MATIITAENATFSKVLAGTSINTPAPLGKFLFKDNLATSIVDQQGNLDPLQAYGGGFSFGANWMNFPQNNTGSNFLRFSTGQRVMNYVGWLIVVDAASSEFEAIAYSPMTKGVSSRVSADNMISFGTRTEADELCYNYLRKPHSANTYVAICAIQEDGNGHVTNRVYMVDSRGQSQEASFSIAGALPLGYPATDAGIVMDLGRPNSAVGNMRMHEFRFYDSYLSDAAMKEIAQNALAAY